MLVVITRRLSSSTRCCPISLQRCVFVTRLQFYSWYIYHEKEADMGKSISAAEFVDDVNKDAVIIVDGLTKACVFRHHGRSCHSSTS